jgi:hypothetical protein
MRLRISIGLVFLVTTFFTGCTTSTYNPVQTQISSVMSNHYGCLAELQTNSADFVLYRSIFPDLKKIGFEQKTRQDWPSEAIVAGMTPLITGRLNCERRLIHGISKISGLRGSEQAELRALINVADVRLRALENAAAGLVLGEYHYGEYFKRYEGALSGAKNAALDLQNQARQRQHQRAVTSTPIFKPYCPPSKYPIYGCPPSTSSAGSSSYSKPPPGNKTCTYRSGPYQWTKTVNGYTCPATDSSKGYFGTLVR